MELQISKNNNNLKKRIDIILKCLLFAVCSGLLLVLTHVINSKYITHVHGKPEFVSISLFIFSACSDILVAAGYLMFGYKIPVKNCILRGIAYMALNLISNYLPQVMGLAFADGPIAQQAFVINDFVCDIIVDLFGGILLGILFSKKSYKENSNSGKLINFKAVLISCAVFPLTIIILDQLIALIAPMCSAFGAIQASQGAKIPFYINFYSWFILSGAVISIFYQITDYRDNDHGSAFKFAMKYSLLLWTPIVMIMVLFGTEIIPATLYNFLFIITINFLVWINGFVLKK